jgi:hypothetical protein
MEFPVNGITAGNQANAAVAARSDGKFVVAWNTAVAPGGVYQYSVWMRVFKNDGAPDGAPTELKVSGAVTDAYFGTLTAFGDGAMMSAWYQGGDGDGNGIFGTWYTTALVGDPPKALNATTTGNQVDPALAATNALNFPYYLAVWTGPDNSGTGTDIHMRLQPR